jgi:hypothetical protein
MGALQAGAWLKSLASTLETALVICSSFWVP